jgi:hypothetical protein
MSTLITNLPPIKVWIDSQYLSDFNGNQTEYVLGYWTSCKSIPGRALYFESYLPEYAALYDKLPISAFLKWDPDYPITPLPPTPELSLSDLEFWNGFDLGITVCKKTLLSNMTVEVRTRTAGFLKGDYLFTIDQYHADRDRIDCGFSEVPEEHKSHNIIALENGQIGAYPNNRCRFYDVSLTYNNLKTPDFKASTRYYDVERVPEWGRLGENNSYFWSTPQESKRLSTLDIN